jgi:hypothetical protein
MEVGQVIFVKVEQLTETKAKVLMLHYAPDQLGVSNEEDAVSAGGVLVTTDAPQPEQQPGKNPVLYINPNNKQFWYEYEDRPLTAEEKIAQLEEQLRVTQETIDFLLGV